MKNYKLTFLTDDNLYWEEVEAKQLGIAIQKAINKINREIINANVTVENLYSIHAIIT